MMSATSLLEVGAETNHEQIITGVIATEAKPRKKPIRRKQKWKRHGAEGKAIAIDIHSMQTKAPYHTKRLVPTLSQLSIPVVKRYWSSRWRDLPHQVQTQLSNHVLQDNLLPCLQMSFMKLEKQHHPVNESSQHLYEYPNGINRRTLFCPFQNFNLNSEDGRCLANLPATHMPTYGITELNPPNMNIIFAGYLNLLLPSFIRQRTHPRNRAKGKYDEQITNDNIAKIREILEKEIPWLTKTYFDFSLPYVWWARGNKLLAERYFRQAIRKSTTDNMTALHYNELGRLFTHFGDQHLAEQCFRTASDFTKYHVGKEQHPQIDLWQAILAASSYDQGFLTQHTSDDACFLWDKIYEFDVDGQGRYQAEVSLVCFHFAHSPITGVDWREAFDKLLLKRSSFLALSLITAMAGYNKAAQAYFDQNCTTFHPESVPTPRSFPWYPIILAVKNHKQPVRPIRMLWRRLLTHPVICERKRAPIFDISHEDTTLWIAEDGYLTGDFQMLLPPIPQVKLNPYTGDIVHSLSHSPTGPWKCNILPRFEYEYQSPSQVRVYEDDELGIVVDLYIVNQFSNFGQERTAQIVLKWTNGENEVRIDLKKDIKSLMKKQLQHPHYMDRYSGPSEDQDRYLKAVEECYQCDYSLQQLQVHARYIYLANETKSMIKQLKEEISSTTNKKAQKRLKMKLQCLINSKDTSRAVMFYTALQSFASYGKALVIVFARQPNTNTDSFFYVFNCESRQTFRSFKSHVLSPKEQDNWNWGPVSEYKSSTDGFASAPSGQGVHYPEASVFVVPRWRITHGSEWRCWSSFTVFNEDGQELTRVFEKNFMLSDNDHMYRNLTCVIGHKLFGIHPHKPKVVCHDVIHDRSHLSRAFPEIISLKMLARFIVVLTVGGVYVLNENLETVHWETENISSSIELADEGTRLQGQFSTVSILSCDRYFADHGDKFWRVLLAVDDKVLLMRLFAGKTKLESLHCHVVVEVPGTPTEACYINETVGFLIASTISDESFHEELYQFSIKGQMLGVLPFLGPGPHKFLPVLLPGDQDAAKEMGDIALAQPSWYVYCFDGYGAVTCIKPL